MQMAVACITGFLVAGLVLAGAARVSRREPTRTLLVPGACLLLFLAGLLVDGPESLGLLLYLLLCVLMVALVSFEDTTRPARSLRWSAVLLTVVGSQIALVLVLVRIAGVPVGFQ